MSLNEKISKYAMESPKIGLSNGKMGACVSLFVLSKHDTHSTYYQQGLVLLQDIQKNIAKVTSIDLEEGLVGIAFGFRFLIKNSYLKGTVNSYLEKMDEYIYKVACRSLDMELNGKDTKTLVDVLLYASLRYGEMDNPYKKEWHRRFLIELLNGIYQKHTLALFREPLPFDIHTGLYLFLYTLVRIRKLGIEQERIDNILGEIQYSLFAYLTMLNPNRYALFVVVSLVAEETKLSMWADFAKLLKGQVDFENLLFRDFYDMSILPKVGVVGMYLLDKIFAAYVGEGILADKEALRKRVVESSFWQRLELDDDFAKKNFSLNGFYGIKLFLDYEYGQ